MGLVKVANHLIYRVQCSASLLSSSTYFKHADGTMNIRISLFSNSISVQHFQRKSVFFYCSFPQALFLCDSSSILYWRKKKKTFSAFNSLPFFMIIEKVLRDFVPNWFSIVLIVKLVCAPGWNLFDCDSQIDACKYLKASIVYFVRANAAKARCCHFHFRKKRM